MIQLNDMEIFLVNICLACFVNNNELYFPLQKQFCFSVFYKLLEDSNTRLNVYGYECTIEIILKFD